MTLRIDVNKVTMAFMIVVYRERKELRTIEVKEDKNGRDYVGNECDKEVDNTLSKKKMPE